MNNNHRWSQHDLSQVVGGSVVVGDAIKLKVTCIYGRFTIEESAIDVTAAVACHVLTQLNAKAEA